MHSKPWYPDDVEAIATGAKSTFYPPKAGVLDKLECIILGKKVQAMERKGCVSIACILNLPHCSKPEAMLPAWVLF